MRVNIFAILISLEEIYAAARMEREEQFLLIF